MSNKKPFSVGSDSICMKLPGNKVDCFKYGTMALNGINTS